MGPNELIGIGVALLVIGAVLGAIYWLVLNAHALRRPHASRAERIGLVLLVTTPIIIALMMMSHRRDRFAEGETLWISAALLLFGLIFTVALEQRD